MNQKFKEFKPTSWSIDNKTSILVVTLIVTITGILSYIGLPKEKFPDIVIPTIYVQTIYPGSAPKDIENLITKPIEKKIKGINGLKKLSSQSVQDFSIIVAEFQTDVSVDQAKQKVKDEVDKARSELPSDLKQDPTVQEVNFADLPILNINIAGDFELNKLKEYAEMAKDRIESLKEITRVDIIGALEREIQVNLDLYKMEAAGIGMDDAIRAIQYENVRIAGGNIDVANMKRSLSVVGEFKKPAEVENIIIRAQSGATLYLRDIAEIKDGFKEKESYARLSGKNVITLNVIKRAGENLIDASDKCRNIMTELQKTSYPGNLSVVLTGDQSTETRVTLHDLINTIIIGFILVTLILMFFMGATNAIFVGLSVPLSMFLAFMVMPALGFSLNMIVLFSFLLALGIVVDDAIVVIENTHRIFANGKMPIVDAAKKAAGEVFLPVFSGTMTTLAPFVPLAFWQGIIGKFMYFLPVTLIITLLASLLVAYIINPVFAVQFMKPHHHGDAERAAKRKTFRKVSIIALALVAIGYISGASKGLIGSSGFGFGNFILVIYGFYALHHFWLERVIRKFQEQVWPNFQNRFKSMLSWCLNGRRPVWLLFGTVVLFFCSIVLTGIRKPNVVFFPTADPNFVYVYLNVPVGSKPAYTDSITKIVENRVYKVLGNNNPIVESVISNVAVGANDPQGGDRTVASHRGKVTVAFVEFSKRDGMSTEVYLEKIRKALQSIPGTEISVEQERGGPPTGKPINIEIRGDAFEELVRTAGGLKRFIDDKKIAGIEELKSDFVSSKPEIVVNIDRERANRQGISTGQIGMALRNSIYGAEASKFRDNNDDYPIQVRIKSEQRNDISALMNMKIGYRDMNMGGMFRQVPLSAVADVSYTNTYGGINRINQKRVIVLGSNLLSGYSPNEVIPQIKAAVAEFSVPAGIEVALTGEQEQQAETQSFLGKAMGISLALILLILVTQFNSISKPIIILSEIIFSIIGVLLGLSIFGMSISIVMTGVGIVALAGIVVRNGILLVEFTELLRSHGVPLRQAIIEAGRTRMTPVLLTASATILGLIPLAIGLNIDFATMFTDLNPHIFMGGDSVAFWGPLSWTMIFGLSFATFLTLILVPAMYLLNEQIKKKVFGWFGKNYDPDANTQPDALEKLDI